MVGVEDDKLIQAEVVRSAPHATSVEMDEVREEEAPGETEEQAPQPPLAGIAPGLPLAPVATEEPNPLDAFTGASAPSLRSRTVIKKRALMRLLNTMLSRKRTTPRGRDS